MTSLENLDSLVEILLSISVWRKCICTKHNNDYLSDYALKSL